MGAARGIKERLDRLHAISAEQRAEAAQAAAEAESAREARLEAQLASSGPTGTANGT